MSETIKILLGVLSAALPLVSTITVLIVKLARSQKAKKIAQQIQFFTQEANNFVVEAEKHLNYTGAEKKEFVATKINQSAIDSKVKYDAQLVSNVIEQVVKITKQVNKREKDKNEELI